MRGLCLQRRSHNYSVAIDMPYSWDVLMNAARLFLSSIAAVYFLAHSKQSAGSSSAAAASFIHALNVTRSLGVSVANHFFAVAFHLAPFDFTRSLSLYSTFKYKTCQVILQSWRRYIEQ